MSTVIESRNKLDSKIDVLLNTEAEAAGIAEVTPQELVLLDLQTALQKLHCLVSSNRNVTGNLLVTPDSEWPHSVSRY